TAPHRRLLPGVSRVVPCATAARTEPSRERRPHLRSSGPARLDRAPREPLAPRAEVRSAVHEHLAHDRGAAARARLAVSAVGVERVREIAGGAVDVDVLGVEARAALGERLHEHGAHLRQEAAGAWPAQRAGGLVVVDAGRPKGLVGVDVADAGDEGLVAQRTLDGRVASREPVEARPVVDGGDERGSAEGSSGSRAMWATDAGSRSSGRSGAGTSSSSAIEPKMRWSTKSSRTGPWPGASTSMTMRVSFAISASGSRSSTCPLIPKCTTTPS